MSALGSLGLLALVLAGLLFVLGLGRPATRLLRFGLLLAVAAPFLIALGRDVLANVPGTGDALGLGILAFIGLAAIAGWLRFREGQGRRAAGRPVRQTTKMRRVDRG